MICCQFFSNFRVFRKIEQTNQFEICLLLPAPASTILDFWDISVNLLSHLRNLFRLKISFLWDFWILRSLCNDAKVVLDGVGGLQHSRGGCSLQWQLSGSSGPRAPLLTTPSTAGHRGTPAHQSHPQSWNKQKPLLTIKVTLRVGERFQVMPWNRTVEDWRIGQWHCLAEQLPGNCSSTSNHLRGNYCATYMKAVMVGKRRGLRVTG